MSDALRIGFVGAGKMATALAKGFIHAGLTSSEELLASDPLSFAREAFERETEAQTTTSNPRVLAAARVIVLAVKPQQILEVLAEIAPGVTPDHLLLSIAAGISLNDLEGALPNTSRVVRVMPNTPALVGASAAGFARGNKATAQDAELTERLLNSVGMAFEVKEPLLDAVTGLSGSGPAYGYLMIEALSDGGVAEGLPRETALKLAAQTLHGAAQMVLESGLHPGALKDMVTSPGGTTIEAIQQLEQGGLRATLMRAVRASARRSRELGGR